MPPKDKDDITTKGELRRAEVSPQWVPVPVVPSPTAPPPQVQAVSPPDVPTNWDAPLPRLPGVEALRAWVQRGRARRKIRNLRTG